MTPELLPTATETTHLLSDFENNDNTMERTDETIAVNQPVVDGASAQVSHEIPPSYSPPTSKPGPTQGPNHPISYEADIEADYRTTLHSLQANIKELQQARMGAKLMNRIVRIAKRATITRGRRNGPQPTVATGHAARVNGVFAAWSETNAQSIPVLEELILSDMRRLSHIHPDPAMQAEWAARADHFKEAMERGDQAIASGDFVAVSLIEKEKDSFLMDIAKGVAILLVTPLALAMGALCGAGCILFGVGKILSGVARCLTCGICC